MVVDTCVFNVFPLLLSFVNGVEVIVEGNVVVVVVDEDDEEEGTPVDSPLPLLLLLL